MVGVLRTERGELFGRAAVLERAAGVHVGQDDGLVGAQDLRGLGHEAHAAERDHLGIGLCRLARQFERVADEIGKVLDLGLLIIVREDHRVALLAQTLDLGTDIDAGQILANGSSHGVSLYGFCLGAPPTPPPARGQFGYRPASRSASAMTGGVIANSDMATRVAMTTAPIAHVAGCTAPRVRRS
jgi:hypothetical protein